MFTEEKNTNTAALLLTFAGKLRKLHSKYFSEFAREHDLSPSEIDVLIFLDRKLDHDISRDIADELSLSKSMVSKAVDSLIRRGYISAFHDEEDRRRIHLRLEEAVMPLVKELRTRRAAFFRQIFKGLTTEELAVQKQIIEKITTNAEEDWKA